MRSRCVGGGGVYAASIGRGQPGRRFGRLVFQKSAELAPARRAVDERQLAHGDAAELHPHRQGDDVQAIDDVRY